MSEATTAQGPLISIGIPTYNRPKGLLRTLRCMLAQTYKNIEIIVSDNSTPGPGVDSVLKMFAPTDRRIRFYRQTNNIGPTENFKFVLSKAGGAYFMWAADDDEWEPEFIERCLSLAVLSGGSGMTGFATFFRVSGTKHNNPLPALSHLNSKFKNSCEYLNLMQPSLFYGLHRREDVMFFLNESTFHFFDCYFILRIIINSGFSVIEDQLYLAGVDSDEYTIKHGSSQISKQFLNYFDFYIYSIFLVIFANGISFSEKLKLILLIDKTVLALITHHEKSKQPRAFLLMNSIKVLWQKLGRYASKKPTFTSSKESGAIDSRLDEPCGVISYAQSGEDSIVEFAMKAMGIE
ncbi:partial Glycosyltransferase GlyG, partial [Methylococcales bacterium]